MAKILVADDNSNVQKTVAHALANLGVEVISVNNGDAAIKRFADISPDLVLADIFMPVRNGYEVCEYVKRNSRSVHVPVVLLVGAFDPLDEREAQRVGADGILKKPFVPPDPLLTMVKTLLDRSLGERLVTVSAPKPAASAPAKAGGVAAAEAQHLTQVEPEEEPSPVEFPAPVSKISFGEGERPVAFGQLLDAPAQSAAPGTGVVDPVDAEQVVTGSRDAALGDPIFWKDEPEPEAEESAADTEEELRAKFSQGDWDQAEETEEIPAHRDAEMSPAPAEQRPAHPVDALELVRDEAEEQNPTIVDTSSTILQDPASVAPLNVQAGRVEELAANPIEWMATVPPLPVDKEELPAVSKESLQVAEDPTEPAHIESAVEPAAALPSLSSTKPISAPEPISIPAIHSTPAPPPVTAFAPSVTNPPRPSPDPVKTLPSVKSTGQKPEDRAHPGSTHDWEDLAATLDPIPMSSTMESPKAPPTAPAAPAPSQSNAPSQPAAPKPSQSADPDPALVDAVVQRVLDKMKPQVLDVITKEFLRPIVQALVHREIEKP